MVGMLLAGASPTDAVRLQLILLYALLGSVAISALVATDARLPQLLHPGRSSCASRATGRRAAAPSSIVSIRLVIEGWVASRGARATLGSHAGGERR